MRKAVMSLVECAGDCGAAIGLKDFAVGAGVSVVFAADLLPVSSGVAIDEPDAFAGKALTCLLSVLLLAAVLLAAVLLAVVSIAG